MAFLWTFLRVFAPAAVKGSNNEDGPAYQLGLRKSLSVLFWNDTLIYGSIIFLSARTICLPFLLDSSKTVLASTVFRRGIRLWFPVAASMIVVYYVFTPAMATRLLDLATMTGNTSLDTDIYLLPNSLANFNAIFMTFWTTHNFQLQAASFAFPSQMLWVISAVFQQSYTVYITMVIIPYTRPRWRIMGAIAFILTAWWVYSWAWYSISGLLVADAVMNMGLRPGGPSSCLTISKVRIPMWIVGGLLMSAGFIMQFFWTAARPDLQNAELLYHTGIYNTGGLNKGVDVTEAQIRADCYLIVLGFFLILETSSVVQSVFRSKFLVLLGRRSLSTLLHPSCSQQTEPPTNNFAGYFLIQSSIICTLGVKIASNMTSDERVHRYPAAAGVSFIATLIVTIVSAEVLYWLVEIPSKWFGRWMFDWIRA